MDEIDLYDAIRQMRKLTAQSKTFSFIHSTYDRSRQKTDGFRYVKKARLRPAAKADDLEHADFKLFYYDEELREPRNCWQMLILFFEGKKVVLN